MSRYLKFIWAGIFLCPKPLYWVMMGLVAVIFVMGIIANKIVDNPYGDAEQQYKITVGYIIKNGKSVPYKIFYTDEQTNKRILAIAFMKFMSVSNDRTVTAMIMP